MTLFVSRGPNYGHVICSDLSEPVQAGNRVLNKLIQPLLIANFRLEPIPPHARWQALRAFRGRRSKVEDEVYGNIEGPYYQHADILTDPTYQLGPGESSAFVAFRPENSFGLFDTSKLGRPGDAEAFIHSWNGSFELDDPLDPASRIHMSELYDRELRSGADFGREYVEITAEKIPPPWPSYDKEVGPGKHDRIAKIVEATGIDPAVVIAYEQAKEDGASAGVIKRMEDLMREEANRQDVEDRFTQELPSRG